MNLVNVALQIIPSGMEKEKAYQIVDSAIKAIAESGLKYMVCPFETVIEGEYNEVMKTVEAAQQAAFNAGAEDLLVYVKLQRSRHKEIFIEDKMKKYK